MDKPKKICLLIPSLQVGGMERVMSELVGYFCRQLGVEVHLVLYGINRGIFYNVPDNLNIHRPAFEFNNNRRLWYTLKTMLFLRRIIKRLSPDSILSFGEYWNNFVLLSLYGLSFSVFVSDRCQPDKSLGWLHDQLRKWLYSRAAGVIVQTETAKAIYSQQYHHPRIVVIGNPIRDIPLQPNLQREQIVLSIGRLIGSKHHDELIQIFVQVRCPNWKLIIVGDDALKQKNKIRLHALIKELGASEFIELVGKRSDVDYFYLRSSIFAFTSSSEGFPNVIGEAMSSGLPVIAYDCIAGPSDLIENGKTGYLIPLHDKNQFANKLKELIHNDNLRFIMGENSKEKIRMYSLETIGEQFIKLLFNASSTN